MTETAGDIIKRALQKAGVLTKVESPTADEANDALQTLNDIISSFSNDGLLVYGRTPESFPITGGTASYTIGSGGDFDTTRPLDIVSAYVKDSGSTDYPVTQIGADDYAKIQSKTTTGKPYCFWYDNVYPLGTLHIYPVPDQSYTLNFISIKPLSSFSSLTTTVDLPPGWSLLLKDALAISLAPEYGVQTPQETLLSYERSLGAIRYQRAKMTNLDSASPPQVQNIYTGWE